MMAMAEFYEMIAEEQRQLERWRKECPCCANCRYYAYDGSTGADICNYWDEVAIDEDKTIYEARCGSWK